MKSLPCRCSAFRIKLKRNTEHHYFRSGRKRRKLILLPLIFGNTLFRLSRLFVRCQRWKSSSSSFLPGEGADCGAAFKLAGTFQLQNQVTTEY